ncbi:hypothetical protein ACU5JM_18460 [Rhodococcus erythropolis]|uniref:hypothetical protein n=1 Tax=Rhodococcus erythropolis TaxID=1833 RepID=UPI00406BA906
MNRTVSGVLVCGVAVLALVGCGKGETTREGAVSSTQTAPPLDVGGAVVEREAAPGDQSQAGLEATLAEQYTHIQRADWASVYEFSSPRCQVKYPVDEFVASLDAGYADRDFSGPEQYLITMNSDSVATVVVKSHDGKGKMTPGTWSYINGAWRDDAC